MSKPVRILHIFGRMNRGGAEMRTLDIMRHIDREQFQQDFCALTGLPGVLDDEIRSLGGEVHYCRLGWSFPWRFRHLLQQQSYDVVHSHVHYASGFMLFLSHSAGVPGRIAHFRSTFDDHGMNLRRTLQRKVMRWLIDRYATQILSVSQGVMTTAWGTDWQTDKRCHVMYNGLDLEPFLQPFDAGDLGIPNSSTVYIHVGRMDPPKNHTRLIAVFREIASRQLDAHLLLVGRGGNDIEHTVRQQIELLGLTDRVTFAGERSDVPHLLRAAHALIFPSTREGLPGVVLEACAAGIPVLASDLPGVCEIAAYFPSVVPLSLNLSNEVWAQEATALTKDQSTDTREHALERFLNSPFNLEMCVEAHAHIWRESANN
jgi:glycosyltransferase involved in cell wall biosynthesis